MAFGDADSTEKATIRTALLNYCERDTLGPVPGVDRYLVPMKG